MTDPECKMQNHEFAERARAAAPDWLQKAWASVKRHGRDTLTTEDIDAEIAAWCREKRAP